ncbi:uncharacterized protein LOC143901633 [Temnothorax americanus]|uniref:uncharacterized protein LOC143901633 n=1 Tax=Temnothorax americanus TaxID=1964332 RepID=UPI004067F566
MVEGQIPEVIVSLPTSSLNEVSTPGGELPFPGSREIIWQAFAARLVPDSALNVMLASLAPATIQQYSRPLRSWWFFCKSRQIDLFCPKAEDFLAFLSKELDSVGSYSALNTSRSAISLISANKIGDHPLVRRFCKGAGILKPPHPKYDFIWDPTPVISKLGSWFPHQDLSLDTLTRKLVLKLALCSGQRCQTLAAIKVSQISLTRNKITIRIADRLKTSAPGRSQPLLSFSRFTGHDNLCITVLISDYLERTVNLRPIGCDFLFITLKRPYRPAGSQTISRWIRSTLVACGVDESFSAHSTRHASTSLAAKKGVSLDLIKRAAGWSGESRMFARFYNRPIVDSDAFANSIFSAGTNSILP